MTDSARSRFRRPHRGWLLLATVVLAIAGIGLSIWMPYHREQQIVARVEGWGGKVKTETAGPEWLLQLVGEDRMKGFKVFGRVSKVNLNGTTVTDAGIVYLSKLANPKILELDGTAIYVDFNDVWAAGSVHWCRGGTRTTGCGKSVTDAGLAHLSGLTNLAIL